MKNKKVLVAIIVAVLLISIVGVTFAAYTYSRSGTSNSKQIVGDIYMHYTESNTLTLSNAMPSSTYDPTKYFEFTIDGKNTNTKYDIIYDVTLNRGDAHATRTERLADKFLKFTLMEKKPGESEFTTVVDAGNYADLSSGMRIWKDTITKNTMNEVVHTYRLYMWINNSVSIGNTNEADYDLDTWNDNVYASIKVNVTGDFTDKEIPKTLVSEIKTRAATTDYVKNYTTEYINNSSYTYNGTRFNTQDKYLDSYTKQDVYYYTGPDAKTNGNVLFAGYCWQIIRTTDTGGVKLLYNGVATNNKCNNITKKTGINGETGLTKVYGLDTTSVYGTGFTYTEAGFVLTGVMTNKTWSSISTELLGTYTCKGTAETCTTLYYIGSYLGTSSAYGASYTLGEITNQYTIGKSAFNGFYNSLFQVGYMYNKVYTNNTISNSKSGTYWSDVDYIGGVYTLLEGGTTNTSVDSTHHYVCEDASNCTSVRYYYYNGYYITLSGGETIEDALYNQINYKSGRTKEDNITPIDDANINVHNSAIKAYLDSWYQTNLTSYESMIDTSAVYCNDRSVKTLGSWDKTGTSAANMTTFLQFKQYSNNVDLRCENMTDRFSTENLSARLTKSIGLLTEPERGLIGYYHYGDTVNYYWTISPYFVDEDCFNYVRYVNANGYASYDEVYKSYPVRPVVSLKANTLIAEGDGKASTPYVIGPKVERTIS